MKKILLVATAIVFALTALAATAFRHGNVYKVAAEIFVVNINFNLTFLAGETENFEWR